MPRLSLLAALIPLVIATPAAATKIIDPAGDFLASYTRPHVADLDVTDFSVNFDTTTNSFLLAATLAGAINPAVEGFYVIGVNTGAGADAPFGAIGQGNVTFDQVVLVQKNGTASVGANALVATISGNQFSITVPLSLLPSTGATPLGYGFNLWSRYGRTAVGNFQIADFAPNNALLTASSQVGAIPEPSTWLTMLVGFGLIGVSLRFSRARASFRQLA